MYSPVVASVIQMTLGPDAGATGFTTRNPLGSAKEGVVITGADCEIVFPFISWPAVGKYVYAIRPVQVRAPDTVEP